VSCRCVMGVYCVCSVCVVCLCVFVERAVCALCSRVSVFWVLMCVAYESFTYVSR